jgi:L-alanine-DL-glutamate epimerase-like enolase superfamily enzyme
MVPTLTPIQEYLVKWNTVHQWFLKDPIVPQDGIVHVSMEPGMGMDLDSDKIESEELVEF